MIPDNTSRFPISLHIILLIIVFLAGSLACFFFLKFRTETIPISTTIQPTDSEILQIDPHSSSVNSAELLYLLSGVIDSVHMTSENGQTTYEIQILTPTGPILDKKFFITEQSTNVVSLDQKGIETKYTLPEIKKGDQVLVNYYLDLQKGTDGQVTKIAVTKN